MTELVLFTTVGCHLCEEAEDMLLKLRDERGFMIKKTDIADDKTLMEHYGTRIPVVRNEAKQQEVDWPFRPGDLINLV